MRRPLVLFAVLLAGSLFGFAACDDAGSTTTPPPSSPRPTEPSGPTVEIVSGTISADTTWTADTNHVLSGAVFVGDGATLTIEPGTHIFGESATNGALIVARGGRIVAEGTAEAPIVMTSDQREGERSRGDWGGLIINGAAPLNIPGGTAEGEGDTGEYGGGNPADDSGVLRYVRVEFAGSEFSPDNELNGIAFQGVGNGTTVDFVQVHFNKDDGVEFFGGTVDAKHVVCTGIADDSFDWTDGWTGRGQFWVAQQRGDDADQGIEADNNGENNDLTPRSHPTLYNITLIGDPDSDEGDESDIGILLREGTAATIAGAIVMGFKETGLDIDNAATYENAESGALVVSNSIFHDNAEGAFDDDAGEDPAPSFSTRDFAAASTLLVEADPMLADPYNHEALDCRPMAGSPALGSPGAALPPADGFFDPVTFVGACGPDDDWFLGWTTFVRN